MLPSALLVVLQHRHHRAAHGHAGAVQRVHELGLALRVAKRACMRRAWKASQLLHELISR
jgi:hypothetical protein